MKKLIDLRVLFVAVAMLEFTYAICSLTPPSLVQGVTGWVLNADGHWIVKLLGASLFTQGLIAWIFRKDPNLAVAKALAFYQIASATADWIMWIIMADEGIFSTPMSRILVPAAIVSHYLLGILLIAGIANASNEPKQKLHSAL
jgi:hypothetical protein